MYEMKEWETLKVYGKKLNEWKHTVVRSNGIREYEQEYTTQIEYAYKEYDRDGNLIRTGSEDFSIRCMNESLKHYRIYTWDGKRFNKGGCRWFDEAGHTYIDCKDRKKLTYLAKKWYASAAEVSIR